MGFNTNVRNNGVSEWKEFYIDYAKLKSAVGHRKFENYINMEMNKIDKFYTVLEKRAIEEKNEIFDDMFLEKTEVKEQSLNHEYDFIKSVDSEVENSVKIKGLVPKVIKFRKRETTITRFLHNLVKINNYKDLNISELKKLAKKHSVIRKNPKFYEKFIQQLGSLSISHSQKIGNMKTATKELYKKLFAKNQPGKIKSLLKRMKTNRKTSDWVSLLGGTNIGIVMSLLIMYWDKKYIPLADIYIGFILFGFMIKIFKSYQINYKFIFNFDVCSNMTNPLYIFTISGLFLLMDILYIGITHILKDKKEIVSFALFILSSCFLIMPFDIMFYSSRFYIISVYGRAFFKPFTHIWFRHFYFVDLMQSFNYSIESLVTFTGTSREYGKVVVLTIPVLRSLQSIQRYKTTKRPFPHLANCMKYLMSISVTLMGILVVQKQNFKYVYIMMNILNTLAGIFWDLGMDWIIIRERYTYPRSFYLFAIIYNISVRSIWILEYYSSLNINREIKGIAEILRRFIWSMIRVEVEHLNNCDTLKSKYIAISGELFYKKDEENPTSR